MTDGRFLDLYERCRVQDQLGWYTRTRQDFERAARRVADTAAVLLALTALAGTLAAGGVVGGGRLWGTVGVVLSALSTVVAGHAALYGFDHHAKLYADAAAALQRLRARRPEPGPAGAVAKEEVDAYVAEAEAIFVAEQGQWGQLVVEIGKALDADRPGEG